METTTRTVPTLAEIEMIVNVHSNSFGFGAYREVYRDSDSPWVIKVDYEGGKVNQREYDNYLRVKPSLSNPSVRLPEMHMVGRYLVVEYVDGEQGNYDCWGAFSKCSQRNGKSYYDKGCANNECINGDNCWAELTKDVSATVADIHYANVKITSDGTVYVIDLGEH